MSVSEPKEAPKSEPSMTMIEQSKPSDNWLLDVCNPLSPSSPLNPMNPMNRIWEM